MENAAPIFVRRYGSKSCPPVVLLHGGPAAAGYLQTLAEGLCDRYYVLEPFQRTESDSPLSVARHIDDLADRLVREDLQKSPLLLGHSWGAMLGLCFAARFPTKARGLILIGCGTFDRNSRNLFLENLRQRMTEEDRRTLERIEREIDAPDHRLAAMGKVMQKVGSVELVCEVPAAQCCSAAYHQTWNDMLSMQRRRIYPAALKAIRVPVVMLHGKEDPHPGAAIRKCLSKWIPHLEYHEFPRAGHYPWLERHARGRFEKVLRERLRLFFP